MEKFLKEKLHWFGNIEAVEEEFELYISNLELPSAGVTDLKTSLHESVYPNYSTTRLIPKNYTLPVVQRFLHRI